MVTDTIMGNEHNNGYYEEDNNAGMQGRPNKLQDMCYSYWIGGAMHILAESHLLDGWALREYVLLCALSESLCGIWKGGGVNAGSVALFLFLVVVGAE